MTKAVLGLLVLSLVFAPTAVGRSELEYRFSTYTENGWDCLLFQPKSGAVKPITAVCR